MNKGQASKAWVGQKIRLQPPARRSGVAADDDWLVVALDDDSVTLEHARTRAAAVVGFDCIRAYFSEPGRNTLTQKYGCLQLLVQVDITPDGKVSTTPLPLQALTSPVVNPLQTDAGQLAAQRYRSLWTAARAAVAYLLVAGASTEQQVFAALAPIGYGDGEANVLARIAQVTQLVQRVQQEDTKATRLLGYSGAYMVNPVFGPALQQLVGEDEELRRLMSTLR
jgi:hypothetical protein